ncbi:MAG: ribosomal L7Ae/L30e/S12e/Gadd45 family protein [Clostridia bacterium]|nr:ribosomal L7Ae/L30e/S12e/Gadd45 family protein [Clostridia bacterium]
MNRALGMLGLCARAGKIQSGEQACELAIKHGQAQLILLDGAASQNTRKAFINACVSHSIPIRLTDADALGWAIGKPGRMIAVVLDGKLAQKLADMLPEPEETGETAQIHNN